jgi:PAS domain S-box-containing protein
MRSLPQSIRVLHVDDDPDLTSLVAAFLERETDRMEVATAESATAGLDHLASADVDCVVSDYDMPGTDGIEFLEAVREDHPDLPFILYTGRGSEAIASEAISAGVTDYLQKESGTSQYTVLANRIRNFVEQYRAKRAVERTEEKLSQVAERTDDVLYIVSADWSELLFVNPAYEEIWGRSAEALEADPSSFLDAVHPDDRERAERSMERLSDGDADAVEYRILTADGDVRWVRGESKPVFDDDGDVSRIVGFVRDVTERKQREDQLRTKTARLEALFEHSPDLVVVHDADGTIRDVNRRYCEELGYTEDELVGRTVWDLDTAATPEEAREFWAELPTHSTRRFDGRLQRRDGSTFPVEIRLVRLDLAGEDRFLAQLRDVTERKEREAELTAERRKFRTLAQEAPAVVYRADTETLETTYVNDYVEDVFGHSPEAWLEDPSLFERAVHPDDADRVFETVESLREGYDAGQLEYRILTADGDVRWVRDHVSWERDGDEVTAQVGILYDVTAAKRNEQRLERTAASLETLNRMVRHDIRNDMSVILGWAELLEDHVDDEGEAYLRKILASGEHVVEITEVAHDYVEALTDDDAVTLRPTPLRNVLRTELELRRESFPAATFVVDGEIPDVAVVANGMLSSVFRNLLNNAVQHNDAARPTVELAVEEREGSVVVTVADDGPGIPEDCEAAALDPAGPDGDGPGVSTGLGLVRSLVDQYDGDVWIADNGPSGTTVRVRLRTAD